MKLKHPDESTDVPETLIDHLLESYFAGKCSEQVVKWQIETILIAGSDTSALTVSFTILMLAMHPDIQDRLFDELHTIYDEQDEQTTYDHLQKLPLLDCCLKESMRLFPVASLIGRTASADIAVSNCTIPKGAVIALSIITLHRVCDVE